MERTRPFSLPSDGEERNASPHTHAQLGGSRALGLIRRQIDYDRKWLHAQAEKARSRGRRHRAISLYRRILAAEPHNPDLLARVAPLLAATGKRFDAWQSYHQAAQVHLSNKGREEALVLYREATKTLPFRFEAWHWVAKLELERGRGDRALDTLLEGRTRLRSRRYRAEAIALLREARSIEPWRIDIVLDMARLLRRSGQSPEAQWILAQLAEKLDGRDLRIVRGAQWRIEPSLKHSWKWIRAALTAQKSGSSRVPARNL
jgi:tetratricopeptide (TPR) repeat protein